MRSATCGKEGHLGLHVMSYLYIILCAYVSRCGWSLWLRTYGMCHEDTLAFDMAVPFCTGGQLAGSGLQHAHSGICPQVSHSLTCHTPNTMWSLDTLLTPCDCNWYASDVMWSHLTHSWHCDALDQLWHHVMYLTHLWHHLFVLNTPDSMWSHFIYSWHHMIVLDKEFLMYSWYHDISCVHV